MIQQYNAFISSLSSSYLTTPEAKFTQQNNTCGIDKTFTIHIKLYNKLYIVNISILLLSLYSFLGTFLMTVIRNVVAWQLVQQLNYLLHMLYPPMLLTQNIIVTYVALYINMYKNNLTLVMKTSSDCSNRVFNINSVLLECFDCTLWPINQT